MSNCNEINKETEFFHFNDEPIVEVTIKTEPEDGEQHDTIVVNNDPEKIQKEYYNCKDELMTIEETSIPCKVEPIDLAEYDNQDNLNGQLIIESEYTSTGTGTAGTNTGDFDNTNLKTFHICQFCSKSFANLSSLDQHILDHPNLHKCSYCVYKTNDINNIETHIRVTHKKIKVFKCPHCRFSTFRTGLLKSHVKEHNIVKKKDKDVMFNCSFCNFNTQTSSSMNRHVITKHPPIECSHCDYITHSKRNLDKHIIAVHIHKENNEFVCSFCDYRTQIKQSISEHVYSEHSKKVVFKCSHCNYKTSNKRALRDHTKGIHNIEEFICTFCDYKSYNKNHYDKHIDVEHKKLIKTLTKLLVKAI